jgi:tetratricopeptide (TPR) repeat protein
MGGVGKTQIALKYIHDFGHDYQQIIWLTADSEVKLSAGFQELVSRLVLTEDLNCSPERSKALVLEWLSSEKGYLLIFDNAEEPEILKAYWPTVTGTVLTTSRNSFFVERRIVAAGMEVQPLGKDNGAKYLLHQIQGSRMEEYTEDLEPSYSQEKELADAQVQEMADARRISDQLGGHPLALAHMACFIQETDISLDKFLEIYENTKTKRTVILHYSPGSAAFDYELSYATCWGMSFSKIQQYPASRLLGILALFDPDSIPEAIFGGYASSGQTEISPLADTATYGIAVALLRRHALLKKNKKANVLSIHRLVQDASVRSLQGTNRLQIAFEDAIACLSRVYPRQKQGASMIPSFNECREFTPQLLSVEQNYRKMKVDGTLGKFRKSEKIEVLAELLCHCGWYLSEIGSKKASLGVLSTARSICEEIHGETPTRLAALILSNTGVVLSTQNKGAEALEYGLLAFKYRRGCLPPNDPQIGESCNNCAGALHDMNRLDEAQKLYEESVSIQENSPTKNAGLLEGSYSNLGRNLMALGRLDEANAAFSKALSLHDQCLRDNGPFFPALTLFLLGNLRMYQRRWEEAEREHRKALEMRRKEDSLGLKHLLTGVSFHQLGRVLHRLGRDEGVDGAVQMLQTAIEIFESVAAEPGLVPRSKLQLASIIFDLCGRHRCGFRAEDAQALQQEARELIDAEPSFKGMSYEDESDWNMLVEYEFR